MARRLYVEALPNIKAHCVSRDLYCQCMLASPDCLVAKSMHHMVTLAIATVVWSRPIITQRFSSHSSCCLYCQIEATTPLRDGPSRCCQQYNDWLVIEVAWLGREIHHHIPLSDSGLAVLPTACRYRNVTLAVWNEIWNILHIWVIFVSPVWCLVQWGYWSLHTIMFGSIYGLLFAMLLWAQAGSDVFWLSRNMQANVFL